MAATDKPQALVFTGSDNIRCETFIRSVRQHGLETGKGQDNIYLAEYAMVNLDGEALYFAEDLEDNVTRDWNLLKKALLKQFGTPPSQRSIPSGIDDRRLDEDDSASVSTKVDSPPEASMPEEHSEPQNQGHVEDIYIAVMGLTGSGKSTFINLASQAKIRLRVGHSVKSCTDAVEVAEPFVMDRRRIHLIDTPGFDDTNKSETHILHMIAAALEASFRKGIILHGIIYVHRISDIRVGGLAKEDFHIFRKICGVNSLKNVIIMTSMWKRVSEEEGLFKAMELEELPDFFKSALDKGARLVHHKGDTVKTARDIIRSILANHPIPLEIQDEMVNKGKSVDQTAAGKEVDKRVAAIIEQYEKKMRDQIAAADKAMKEKDAATRKEMLESANTLRNKIENLENERSRGATDYENLRKRLQEVEARSRRRGCTIM